ncbi:MAG: type II toxin-antitoxin system RelB/DinJ family antitoxin [Lachnospiraceae bacterium]|nr:type II toxin-antitoxin system RelB/DinJ family antitoxin [Ruminococcus sp.]MCM1275725.1 type II toxin-antitoxin system RelB/DinJ family antitoxin [Lachnospiraceae bacterium]
MSTVTFSVRMDENLKRQFDALCEDFGMTASTALNVFAKAVVRERKIPFEISAYMRGVIDDREIARKAFEDLRRQAAINFPNGMSLEEINEEIRKARNGED